MRQTVGIERFLFAGSKTENITGHELASKVGRPWAMLLRTLQIIGFVVLSTFGAWPALTYVVYMAMSE